jgi:hypothetical protein
MSHRLTNQFVQQASLEFAVLQESFNAASLGLADARENYERKQAEYADAERALALAMQSLGASATAPTV